MSSTKTVPGTTLKDYLLAVSRLRRPAVEERAALLAAGREGDAQAWRDLTEGFLPMVVALAAARRGLGLRFQDLLACGNQAAAAALRSFQGEAPDLEAVLCAAVENALKRAWVEAAWGKKMRA
jgi:DNA-directed RNA polymerase sigma subunit (sigma70/sigma32)